MKISELVNPIKVCDLTLNNNVDDKPLWDISWDLSIENSILTQKNGRCYYIVVDGEIFKIGYSDCEGGIKSTINSYRSSGNSGRPSDRTHGIHVLITEQLLLDSSVEIYFHYNPIIEVNLCLMNGDIITIENSISGKILEIENVSFYRNKYNKFPVWNLQEAGNKWPEYIRESRNSLLSGTSLTIQEIKDRLF